MKKMNEEWGVVSSIVLAFRAATHADFQSAQTELQERGVSFQFQDHEIAHSIYFHDPDGVLLEITT